MRSTHTGDIWLRPKVFGIQRETRVGSLYLAVMAVLGILTACSIVLGRPACVPGRINPERGRPDWESGLRVRDKTIKAYKKWDHILK